MERAATLEFPLGQGIAFDDMVDAIGVDGDRPVGPELDLLGREAERREGRQETAQLGRGGSKSGQGEALIHGV